jgi:hypothetical protein
MKILISTIQSPFQGFDFFGDLTQRVALGWHESGRWPWGRRV